MSKPCIYFDNSATTCPYDEVVDTIFNVSKNFFGNPSSYHSLGFASEKIMKEAAGTIAASIHANTSEIYFTSGGTESNNLAILGSLKRNTRLGKKIITSAVEHPSVLNVYHELEKKGYHVVYLPVDHDGFLDLDRLIDEIDNETAIVSLMHVNNETGTIFPIEKVASEVKRKNPQTLLHVDAVQSYCKLPLDVEKTAVDLLSTSAHKVHGPRGCGFLYIRKGIKVAPIVYGGGQMQGLRSGTENVASISGFAKAVELSQKDFSEKTRKQENIKKLLINGIFNRLDKITINTPTSGSAPNIVNLSFNGIRSEVLLHSLDQEGIYVSSGSACSAHKKGKSHVLTAMGKSTSEIDSAIRFSFSSMNTEDEANYAIHKIVEIVTKLRKVMR